MKNFLQTIWDWFTETNQRRVENMIGSPVDLSDLHHRLQNLRYRGWLWLH